MKDSSLSLESLLDKSRMYRAVLFMGMSALMTSAAIIAYSNHVQEASSQELLNGVNLVISTLIPYMISAVIAAMTAIGVMTILPTTRVVEPTKQIVARLNDVARGDMTTRVRLHADDPLKDVANSFNNAVADLGNQIAQWKVINRQQWGVLCHIRHAIEMGKPDEALNFVGQMERNWDKIAEIEEKFVA